MAKASGIPPHLIELTAVNKYVGYSELKCKIDFTTVKAEVRLAKAITESEIHLDSVILTIYRIERRITIDQLV